MSADTDTKLDLSEDQTTSSKPRSAEHEAKTTEEDAGKTTYTGMATSAAASAATTATATAAGVKDNVFSMFGGGAKKEKKEDPDEPEDRSGSLKSKKEAEVVEAEADAGVLSNPLGIYELVGLLTMCSARRETMPPSLLTYTLSQLCILPRELKPRPMRSWRSRLSRCAPSSSSSIEIVENGRSEAQVMLGY